jgi:phosphatidylglycerol:prolipoprotein diacylglycerol transferase
MHPILFRIPIPSWDLPLIGKVDGIPIYSYGVMLGLSLVVGWYLTLGLAERDGMDRETLSTAYVVCAFSSLIMSRVLYVLTNLEEFSTLGSMFSMRQGGLVAYGGFIGGFVGSWAFMKWKRIRLMPWGDIAVPSIAIGLAITRIGCYLFGCDYGKPLSSTAPEWLRNMGTFPRWAEGLVGAGSGSPAFIQHYNQGGHVDGALVRLPPGAEFSLPVHPTQIYESLVGFGLVALLLWTRKRQSFRGQIFFLFTFAYGAARFLLEMLRDDPERGNVPGRMAAHILLPICFALFAAGYAFSFSRLVENKTLRRVTQVAAFVPAIAAAILLRPESFAADAGMQLSTSQFIGLASGLAVCVAYVLFENAALAHPEAAMELYNEGYVPPEPEKKKGEKDTPDVDDVSDADDDAADSEPKPKAKKKKRAKKPEPEPEPEPEPASDSDEDEEPDDEEVEDEDEDA